MVFLVVPSCFFVGCIDGMDVYHTSQYYFSPEGNKPNGNYFMGNACVRFLFTSSKVAKDERYFFLGCPVQCKCRL